MFVPMIYRGLRWWFASLILMIFWLPLGAVTNSAWFARAWQTEDGLPEHTIVGLEQTPDGYLWVATHRSLSRFDGVRFQELASAAPAGPTADQIRALLSDRRGRLWLAKDGGTVLCGEAGKVTQVFVLVETSRGAPARAIAEDGRGNIWVSDSTGSVFRIEAATVQAFGMADGRHVKVTLNGTVILDVDLGTLDLAKCLDATAHPGLRRTHGEIGWLGQLNGYEQEGPVFVRNLCIKSPP